MFLFFYKRNSPIEFFFTAECRGGIGTCLQFQKLFQRFLVLGARISGHEFYRSHSEIIME